MVFYATFNNILVISCLLVLLVAETGRANKNSREAPMFELGFGHD